MCRPLSALPARRTRTHWTIGSDEPIRHATRAVPSVLVSENPAEDWSVRIETRSRASQRRGVDRGAGAARGAAEQSWICAVDGAGVALGLGVQQRR